MANALRSLAMSKLVGAASVSRALMPPIDADRARPRALILIPVVVANSLRSPLLFTMDSADATSTDVVG